jgi:hypothetical protein
MNIGNLVVKWVMPLVKDRGAEALKDLLQDMHDAHPLWYNQTLVGAYPLIDVQLEDFVKTTGTKIDDELVALLKKVLEESAAANSIELPNLDKGKPND